MISLLPSSPASDTNGAFAIIALIADPVASKARLDELVAQAKANEESLAAANEAQKAAAADRAKAKDTLDSANQVLSNLVATNRARAERLTAREADLGDASAALRDRAAALDLAEKNSQQDLGARETAVAARETEVEALITKASVDAAAAATARAELERKLSQLKALAS